jgi:hypothetical protein
MTAPAAGATSAPIAPAAPRAAPQSPADRNAFGAVLDSLPSPPAKAGASTGEREPHPSDESQQDQSPPGQPALHSLLNDSALLASLPFALRTVAMVDERPQATDTSPSLASLAMKGSKSEESGASIAAGAKAQAVGRLIGERAFHFSASTIAGAGRTLAVDTPFAPAANPRPQADLKGESVLAAGFARDEATAANPLPGAVSPIASATGPAPSAPRAGAPPSNRASLTRAAAHEAARSGQKPEGSAPAAVVRVTSSPAAPAESSAKTADGRRPDPTMFGAPPTAQTSPFGAQPPGPFVAGAAFGPDASTAGAANADVAPRANALGPGTASSASPGRPRGCLDDDAAYRRQAFSGHPRSQLSHLKLNRRRARRDYRSNGGDRPAAPLARCQTDGRQHGWECEWKRAFR